MKPIQCSAHERPITKIRINRDGDLLFSVGKDGQAMAWYLNDGMRLGTYEGHNGALNDIAVDFDTKYCLTGGADCRFGLWDVCTGEKIRLIEARSPDRVTSVEWNCGGTQFLVSTFGSRKSYTLVYNFDEDKLLDPNVDDLDIQPLCIIPPVPKDKDEVFEGHTAKITEALWGPVNEFIYTASGDGNICKWRVDTQVCDIRHSFAEKAKVVVTSMEFSRDKTLLVATGKDCSARIFLADTLTQIKYFESDKPLLGAAFHPTLDLILCVGGQDAMDVTTTGAGKGKFEVEFYHTVFQKKIGELETKHFSPLNCIAISTDGSYFVTGAEEGNCRIFKFPPGFAAKFKTLENAFVDMTPTKGRN